MDRFAAPITATKLYKLLALYDFEHLIETGVPALDIEDYQAWENGPIPVTLYNEIKNSMGIDKYIVNVGYNDRVREIKNNGNPDMDYISARQKGILDKWLDELGDSSTERYIEASHAIMAWRKAWDRRAEGSRAEPMNYIDEFDENKIPESYYAYLECR